MLENLCERTFVERTLLENFVLRTFACLERERKLFVCLFVITLFSCMFTFLDLAVPKTFSLVNVAVHKGEGDR